MEQRILQGASDHALVFWLASSSDHISPATGKSPTVVLSKSGGAFAAPAGAVSELAHGWYQCAANVADVNTLGPLILHAEATGADPADVLAFVVPSYSAGPYYSGTPGTPLPFLLLLSSDHLTGATGAGPSVLIAGPGGSFAAPAGTVQEVGHGWYCLVPTAADLATAGPLKLNATAAGCDPADYEFDVLPAQAAGGSIVSGAATTRLTSLVEAIEGIAVGTGLFTARSVFVTLDLDDEENFARTTGPFCAIQVSANVVKQEQYRGGGTYTTGMDGEIVLRVGARMARDTTGMDSRALLTAQTGLLDLGVTLAAALDGQFPEDESGQTLTQIETYVTRVDAPRAFIRGGEKYRTWRYVDLHLPFAWTMKVAPK